MLYRRDRWIGHNGNFRGNVRVRAQKLSKYLRDNPEGKEDYQAMSCCGKGNSVEVPQSCAAARWQREPRLAITIGHGRQKLRKREEGVAAAAEEP